ncbi:MAG: inorganic phosphate transporter, partial [Chloroflexi bacterium]|nr:inorganic phosphate transporter [Chloroflexota bacterium]
PAIPAARIAVRSLPRFLIFGALALAALHVANLTPGTSVYVVGIAVLGGLAFGSGANDLPKSISTLIGAGVSSRSRALALGSLATLAGAAVSLFGSVALVRLFSPGGITSESIAGGPAFAIAISIGAAAWVLAATRFGLPVSTTHAIVGASVGAAVMAAGSGAVNWGQTALLVAIPLLVGPLLAAGLGSALGAAIIKVDRRESVSRRFSSVHVASAMGSAAARAWNDTPKLVGVGYLLLGAKGEGSLSTALCLTGLIGAAMLIGGVWASRRVDETLAFRLADLNSSSGLAANAANTVLVSGASILGLPLSTTHVSGGALVGASLGTGKRPVHGKVAGEVLAAWVLTVPGAGLLAAVSLAVFRLVV